MEQQQELRKYIVQTVVHEDDMGPGALQAVLRRGGLAELIDSDATSESWEVVCDFDADNLLDAEDGVISYTETTPSSVEAPAEA